MNMEKILHIFLWISCIGLLSFAYEDYLYAEFSMQKNQGTITEKGVERVVRNIYGNYGVVNEYWLQLDDEKLVVTKAVYQSVKANDAVNVSRTKHGTLIEKQ
jgi:hypothetical protein